jgi:pseudouridine synthase
METNKMPRLYSYIKNYGGYTKSEVSTLQNNHQILVNGEEKNLAYLVREHDIVTISNKVIQKKEFHYFLFYKPIGLICTSDRSNPQSVAFYLQEKYALLNKYYCVGRLDKQSSGVLFLTNDGLFCHTVLSHEEHYEKEYMVKVKNTISDLFCEKMKQEFILDGKTAKCVSFSKICNDTYKIILNEGKYHEIRRMTKLAGNQVVDLTRIRIGRFTLDSLAPGEMKEITIE